MVLRIDHVQGTDDHLKVCIDGTTLTCSSCGGSHLLPAALPSGTYEVTVPVMDVRPANTGTMMNNAYWLLVKSESGSASTDVVQSAFLEVVYLPD